MNVRFTFMSVPGTFEADVPPRLGRRSSVSVVSMNGISRSIQYLSYGRDDATIFRGKRRTGETRGRDGAPVSVYTQPDPLTHFLYWDLRGGRAWTWVDPVADGDSAVADLAGTLGISVKDEQQPRLQLGGALRGGDLRRPSERDQVILYGDDERKLPPAVTFTFAGAFASDRELGDRDRAIVVRGTPLGIEVSCDGPAASAATLRATAEDVAASLRRA
jgi:hypothetical protein